MVDSHVKEAMGDTLYDMFLVSAVEMFLYIRWNIYYLFRILLALICYTTDIYVTILSSFQSNPETLYMRMNAVQADVLVSNKVNIPGSK